MASSLIPTGAQSTLLMASRNGGQAAGGGSEGDSRIQAAIHRHFSDEERVPSMKRSSKEKPNFAPKVARSEKAESCPDREEGEVSEEEGVQQGSRIDRTRQGALRALSGQADVRRSVGARGFHPTRSEGRDLVPSDVQRSKAINQQIILAGQRRDVARLWAILAEEIRSFDAVNISTWIYQCAKQSNANELFQDPRFKTVKTVLLEQLSQFSSQSFSNTAWAFATAEMFDEDVFGKISEQIKRRENLRDFNAQNLSNTAWALATAEMFDGGVFGKIAEAIKAREDLRDFQAQGLSNTAWAFAIVEMFDEDVFGKIAEAIKAREDLRDFQAQGLSNTAWAFVTAGKSDSGVLGKIAEEIKRRDLRYFNSQDLSNMAWAFAKAGMCDSCVFGKIAGEIKRRGLRDFKPQELSNTAWAFAICCTDLTDRSTEACLKEIVKKLLTRASQSLLSLEDRSQVALAAAFFQIETHFLDVQDPRSSQVSDLEKDVKRYLPREFVPQVDLGRECAHHIADFFRKRDRMVIEVDGPWHFYPRSDHPLPQTVLRNAILERNGFKVKTICYLDWDRLRSEEDKSAYIEELLRD